jgi:signal transduction histidine kinase
VTTVTSSCSRSSTRRPRSRSRSWHANGRSGALTLACAESGRQYDEADIAVAVELARRAALAVDNAVLFEREREARGEAERALERLRGLEEISEAALEQLDLDPLLDDLLDRIRTTMRSDTAVALLLDESGDELVAQWARGLEEEVEAGVHVPVGRGFAGRVAAERRPVFIPDVGTADLVNPLLVRKGLHSLLGVPLIVEGRLLGVLHVGSLAPRVFTEQDERTLQLLADRAALAIDKSRLYENERAARAEAEEARQQLEFLSEASELLTSTLDYRTALRRLSDLAVPHVADWCIVDMLGVDGTLDRLAATHADPEKAAKADWFVERFPPDPDAPHGPTEVVRTGQTELIEAITDEQLVETSRGNEKLLEALRALGLTSLMCVPLVARGRVLGAITLLSDRPGRHFGPSDLATARELARRAAVAVDNARLYDQAERRADAARVLEHIGDGVFLVDSDGTVRLWNRAAEAITQLPAQELVGRPAVEAVPGWAEIADRVPIASAPVAPSRAETLPLELPSRELWLSIAGVGFAGGVVYAFRDLTEERMLEELRSEFVSTVSHELRTPLAAIYGAAVTLRRADLQLDESQHDNLLGVIANEADRLARTVNDILWASRLDSNRLQLSIVSCDATDLARTVVDAARTHLPQGIDLTLSFDPSLPPAVGDPDKVRQVLANLVDNAIKYSPDGGPVEVALSGRDHAVRFTVRDLGLGIPTADHGRIFDKFYRLDPNLTRGVGGTGLGLYICRELVRRMEGEIWVESREGEGSRFTFELPAAGPRPRTPGAASRAAPGLLINSF